MKAGNDDTNRRNAYEIPTRLSELRREGMLPPVGSYREDQLVRVEEWLAAADSALHHAEQVGKIYELASDRVAHKRSRALTFQLYHWIIAQGGPKEVARELCIGAHRLLGKLRGAFPQRWAEFEPPED